MQVSAINSHRVSFGELMYGCGTVMRGNCRSLTTGEDIPIEYFSQDVRNYIKENCKIVRNLTVEEEMSLRKLVDIASKKEFLKRLLGLKKAV